MPRNLKLIRNGTSLESLLFPERKPALIKKKTKLHNYCINTVVTSCDTFYHIFVISASGAALRNIRERGLVYRQDVCSVVERGTKEKPGFKSAIAASPALEKEKRAERWRKWWSVHIQQRARENHRGRVINADDFFLRKYYTRLYIYMYNIYTP